MCGFKSRFQWLKNNLTLPLYHQATDQGFLVTGRDHIRTHLGGGGHGLTAVDLALLSKRKIDASILSLFCSGDRILYFFFFDFLDHYRQFQCILAPIFSLPRPESDLPTYLVICL